MRTALKLLVLVFSLAVALCLAEGAWSLATGRSLATRLLTGEVPDAAPARLGFLDVERIDAAKLTTGRRATHPDPEVGFTMKWNQGRKIVGVVAHTDRYGQRRRAGPAPQEGAFRIVFLGDSVAFGFGVADDQTFGHCLEEHLTATMAEGTPPPVVHTVACPDWNNRAQVRYLRTHLGRLDPDLVVMMPVSNDLDDHPHLNEIGTREPGFDPARAPADPHVSSQQFWQLQRLALRRLPRSAILAVANEGMLFLSVRQVTYQGLTRESRRRWDGVRERMRDLVSRLEARGAPLLLAFRYRQPFEQQFDLAVRADSPGVRSRYLFDFVKAEDTLEKDSHPNPRFIRAGAWCIADELIRLGWVPGAGARDLPPFDEAYADRRQLRGPDLETLRQLVEDRQATWLRFHESEFDLQDCLGFHQVYGGLHPSGAVGRSLLIALKNEAAQRGTLRLTRLPRERTIYPLALTITCDGHPAGRHEIPAPPQSASEPQLEHQVQFEIPPEARSSRLIDVHIEASNWCEIPVSGKRTLVAWHFQGLTLHSD